MIRGTLGDAFRADEAFRFTLPPPASTEVAEQLLDRYGDGDRPLKSRAELDALLARLRAAGFAWEKVASADRADIVWVLWQSADPPAEHAAFLQNFLRWIDSPWRRIQVRRLASSWAAAFDERQASIRTVGGWLAAHVDRLGAPWSRLAEELDIFSPERAAMEIGAAFLDGDEAAAEFLRRLGLPPRAAAGNLVLKAVGAIATAIRARLNDEPRLIARLTDFADATHLFATRDETSDASDALVDAIRARLAEAILLPWERHAPPDAVKESIIGFLLARYGDPRTTGKAWESVVPGATKMLRGWLNRDALAIFFGLAGKPKAAERFPWHARAKFWLAAVDQLDDAWLILGSRSSVALKHTDPGHGRLVGCGAEHAALLLKLRSATIVLSSHAPHERVWLAGNKSTPPRYGGSTQSYSAAALSSGADFSSSYAVHDGDDGRKRLREFILRHTGISWDAD
jgi:hypothetical protein